MAIDFSTDPNSGPNRLGYLCDRWDRALDHLALRGHDADGNAKPGPVGAIRGFIAECQQQVKDQGLWDFTLARTRRSRPRSGQAVSFK